MTSIRWACILCHHAAIISRHAQNWTSAKHYYEQSLNSKPENARALYGLAVVTLEQGQLEIAKQYAARCYAALLQSEDEVLKQGLLDLLMKQWPDLTQE